LEKRIELFHLLCMFLSLLLFFSLSPFCRSRSSGVHRSKTTRRLFIPPKNFIEKSFSHLLELYQFFFRPLILHFDNFFQFFVLCGDSRYVWKLCGGYLL